jgi:hypothetical protein
MAASIMAPLAGTMSIVIGRCTLPDLDRIFPAIAMPQQGLIDDFSEI